MINLNHITIAGTGIKFPLRYNFTRAAGVISPCARCVYRRDCGDGREYLSFGPAHHRGEQWDLVYLQFSFCDQLVEVGSDRNC